MKTITDALEIATSTSPLIICNTVAATVRACKEKKEKKISKSKEKKRKRNGRNVPRIGYAALMLLQLEIQIAQNDTVAAETTTHEHQELDRQHNMHRDEGNSVTTSSSSSSSSSSTLTSSLTLNM